MSEVNPFSKFVPKEMHVGLVSGGMGDQLCSFPSVEHLAKEHPNTKFNVFIPDYLLELCKTCFKKFRNIRVISSNLMEMRDKTLPAIHTGWDKITPMRIHPAQYSSLVLMDTLLPVEKLSYPQPALNRVKINKFKLPKKYVCVLAGGREYVKTMPPKTVNKVTQRILKKGYTPVFIGTSSQPSKLIDVPICNMRDIDMSKGISLIDKTTVVELLKVLQGAACFVGMDGGLMHLAGFTNIPIISGFTFVNPSHILPIREGILGNNCYAVEPPESLDCRFCQTNNSLVVGHDFRVCPYGTWKCRELDAGEFIGLLETVLKE